MQINRTMKDNSDRMYVHMIVFPTKGTTFQETDDIATVKHFIEYDHGKAKVMAMWVCKDHAHILIAHDKALYAADNVMEHFREHHGETQKAIVCVQVPQAFLMTTAIYISSHKEGRNLDLTVSEELQGLVPGIDIDELQVFADSFESLRDLNINPSAVPHDPRIN